MKLNKFYIYIVFINHHVNTSKNKLILIMNENTQTDELTKESQLNLLTLVQKHHQLIQASQQHSTNAFSFDFVSTMATSQVCVDNYLLRPKIIKIIDTIQIYLDLINEKLVEQIGKHREHELIGLTKKSSDLIHRQKLQALLIESIKSNDWHKASFVNSFLGNQLVTHSFSDCNFNQTEETSNTNEDLITISRNINSEANVEFNMNQYNSSLVKDELYFNNLMNNQSRNEKIDLDEEHHISISSHLPFGDNSLTCKPTNVQLNLTESFRRLDRLDAFAKAKKTNPLSPIRHLICSPGLEARAQNCKIIILYRGKCNGVCYQNKPWSKEIHIHYIINTVNCNDHVSRLVKKQGIQFYNSFVLQNQDRIKQLIQMYKMEKV